MQFFKDYPIIFLMSPGAKILLSFAIVWTLAWKGVALWQAAKQGSKAWFIVLFLVNTLGILDILYIYVLSKKTNGTGGDGYGQN